MARRAVSVRGIVQGVGFRPFVFQHAKRFGISGWVKNEKSGVKLEIQGAEPDLDAFMNTLEQATPRPAEVRSMVVHRLPDEAAAGFSILPSSGFEPTGAAMPADLAVCAECAREVTTRGNRRYAYAFTNCAQCGPRYSITIALPYDRSRTTMKEFAMCADCRREYSDANDRRFHAQPIACPRCGPELVLCFAAGNEHRCYGSRVSGEGALTQAAAALKRGQVVALKGLGGFQLLVDARSETAVLRLRQRKARDEKPFAVLFSDLAAAKRECDLTAQESEALLGPEAPIVLVRRRRDSSLSEAVAPGNPLVGALLAYSPLHRMLSERAEGALVCTSGNVSDEPLCTDNADAMRRLGGLADVFLTHDRPIARALDDSVARVGPKGLGLLRRARGYAPLPVASVNSQRAVLSVGGHLKNTIAITCRGELIVSQHLGDLSSARGVELLEHTVRDLLRFFDVRPELIVCDLHPDYASTRLAEQLARERRVPLLRVQHHLAHVAAVVAEHGVDGEVAGLAWDGMGLGFDGRLWGGEAFKGTAPKLLRFATLRDFPLPGGERAARQPRRSALGLLFSASPELAEQHCSRWFEPEEATVLLKLMAGGLNAPLTSSIGRLFDAIAAVCELHQRCSFEAQAAMALEFAAEEAASGLGAYPLPLDFSVGEGEPCRADPRPLLCAVLSDKARGEPASVIARRFHEALAELGLCMAKSAGLRKVVLSGGCFQNHLLSQLLVDRLEESGFEVYLPRKLPPGDGGLSLGQAFIGALTEEREL